MANKGNSRVKRPTAVDVGLSEEQLNLERADRLLEALQSNAASTPPLVNPLTTSLAKRESDHDIATGKTKKPALGDGGRPILQPAYYRSTPLDNREDARIFLPGEDELEQGERRTRILDKFVIVSIEKDELCYPDDLALGLEAVGLAAPFYENSEDAGQDDDIQDFHRIRTARIKNIEFTTESETNRMEVCIETEHSIYILCRPAAEYASRFRAYLHSDRTFRKKVERPEPLRRLEVEYDERTIDDDALKHQTQTHVTPFIQREARGCFKEKLYTDGVPLSAGPSYIDNVARHREELLACIDRARKPVHDRKVPFKRRPRGQNIITVEGIEYKPGDVALLQFATSFPDVIPPTARMEDYFRFAKIMYLSIEQGSAHLMYYHPSSCTPFTFAPGQPRFEFFCGKVEVMTLESGIVVPEKIPTLYFSRYLYHDTNGSFVDHPRPSGENLQDYCPTCEWEEEHDAEATLKTRGGVLTLRSRGTDFHINDYVLFCNDSKHQLGDPSVGVIGQIREMSKTLGHLETIDILLFERQIDNAETAPIDVVLDPQELLATRRIFRVPVEDIVQKVHVRHVDQVGDPIDWTARSPSHFIVRHRKRSDERVLWLNIMPKEDVLQCDLCVHAKDEDEARREEWARETAPKRVIDAFGGTGSFAMAIAEGYMGRMKLTHAIEVAPSAAKSLKLYSPETVVYNQCTNSILSYIIRSAEGKPFDEEKDVRTNLDGTELPPAPRKEDLDGLIAGFPCQPHSTLNRFQNYDEPKSNKILTTLSVLDALQLDFAYVENVPGFLNYSITHRQHPTPPDSRATGLRFLVNVLLKMGYQVQFSLLNAAHFGAPQRRGRFFLVAMRGGLPMPRMPYPTHAFNAGALEIRMSNKKGWPALAPLHPKEGTYLFKYTTIAEAISDLPPFDSYNPGIRARNIKVDLPKTRQYADPAIKKLRGPDVPSVRAPAADEEQYLKSPRQGYRYAPRTMYQVQARKKDTKDLQHYSIVLLPWSVELICNIPLRKDVDFRELPRGFWDWQMHSEFSASSRRDFKTHFFARVNYDGVTNAIVVHTRPTATQSKVLHPWCDRVLSIRELARAQGFSDDYVFVSLSGSMKLMLRQIGNAVPWQIGRALGRELSEVLYQQWLEDRGYSR